MSATLLDLIKILAPVLAFGMACALTLGMRRYALNAQLIDHPNGRSSHTTPTPRGGGVSIVLTFLAFLALACLVEDVPHNVFAAIFGGGAVVALTGFIDDRGHIPARWRFLAHLAAAIWVLWQIGPLPPVPVLGVARNLGAFGVALAAIYIVWMINLCNFMDGIDGIAGVEAITVSLGGALCCWIALGAGIGSLSVLFAACVAGFLVWNYPPAKIFMGDSGSGFVGFTLAAFSLCTALQQPRVFWCWFILLGCFMVDATTTLVRRVRRGDKFHEAHRSHAYQYAARKHQSHERVSLTIGLLNVVWLLPIALLVALSWLDGVVGVLIAYAPMVWLAFRYKAGDRAAQGALG